MAYQQSVGINVTEIDLSTVVPGVATSEGAISGVFRWGPVNERVLIDSETQLVNRFGKPTNLNAETFFTAASFLGYSNQLFVVRAGDTTGTSPIVSANIGVGVADVEVGDTSLLENGMILIASSNTSSVRVGSTISITNSTHVALAASSDALGTDTGVSIQFVANTTVHNSIVNTASVSNLALHIVKSEDDYTNKDGTFDTDVQWIARWPGEIGDSLKISVCDTANAFQSNVTFVSNTSYSGNTEFTVGSNTGVVYVAPVDITASNTATAVTILNSNTALLEDDFQVGDLLKTGNTTIGTQYIKVTAVSTTNAALGTNSASSVDVTANSTTLTTSANAFTSNSVGSYLAIFSGVDEFDVARINGYTNATTVTVASNISFTNAAADFGVYTPRKVDISLQDEYRLSTNWTSEDTITRSWEYFELFDDAPGTSAFVTNFGNTAALDELHATVIDEDGKFTGVPGTVLEKFTSMSRASDSKTIDGASNYYKNVINEQSAYVWWANDRSNAVSNTAVNVTSSTNYVPYTASFNYGQNGADESTVSIGTLATGYDKFASVEEVEIGLVMQGKARGGSHGGQLANYLIDNIAEHRIDCVVFASPDKSDVVNNVGFEATDVVAMRNTMRSSSYGFLDSGYKYMYDRYNDVYRWIPLNGDTAGLTARTEITNDAWWSPAGYNRGNIRNIVKLAYNPRKSDRDILYKKGINPVVTFPGEGTILYGDKTLLAKPSAFDRINVRRLFIVIEKAISRSSKYTLFEFNDSFTRAQFRNLVTPYLRDVQGRRGITDFLVVCDDTNNTAEVIDRNEFVADIYIKPARSINFIQLNFVAVRTGIAFSEVVGQF